jgi:hypothetical protein
MGSADLRDWAPPTYGTLHAQNDEVGRFTLLSTLQYYIIILQLELHLLLRTLTVKVV